MPDDVIRDRKTQPTGEDATAFLNAVPDAHRRQDAQAVVRLMREVTGVEPELWGSMIGFGRLRYTGSDHKIRETMAIGLAARKAALTLYGMTYDGSEAELLTQLGPHTTGKGCLYIKRLADIDEAVLRELVIRGWAGAQAGSP